MKNYRIIFDNYYERYFIQRRFLLFFWVKLQSWDGYGTNYVAFGDIAKAKVWLNEEIEKQTEEKENKKRKRAWDRIKIIEEI